MISKSQFIRGEQVECFEEEFAQLFGMPNCVSCANGTDALFIAIKSLGIKNGDEVIVPACSWISTSQTVSLAGGKVVFCDIDPLTFNIDASKVEKLISPNTVGIIPVHLYGQPCDIERICELAERHSLWVIEDCAQAHMATLRARKWEVLVMPRVSLSILERIWALWATQGQYSQKKTL